MKALPTIEYEGELYFIDLRLREVRNTKCDSFAFSDELGDTILGMAIEQNIIPIEEAMRLF